MITWNEEPKKRNIIQKAYYKFFQNPKDTWLLNTRRHLKQYSIGDYSFGQLQVKRGVTGNLTIGKFCSIGKGTIIILGGEHRSDWVTTYPFPGSLEQYADKYAKATDFIRSKGDVVIGHDVWIGEDSYILSGVIIGNGAVIGARSVVRRDIPPYAIAMGNPARVAGYRFEKDVIDKLESISWWDWDINKVVEALPYLLSDDIDRFINKYINPDLVGESN